MTQVISYCYESIELLLHDKNPVLWRLFWFYTYGPMWKENKANLRDLIAATGLVILLKFDPNHQFFNPCDLEIWCMISKNKRTPLLYYIKLCVIFQIHRWIQTEITLRKRSIRVEIGDFLSLVTLKFDGWPWKTIGHLFYTTSSCVHHFKSIGELNLKLQFRNAQFGSKSAFFLSCVTLKFDGCPWKTIGHHFYVASSKCIISQPSVNSN